MYHTSIVTPLTHIHQKWPNSGQIQVILAFGGCAPPRPMYKGLATRGEQQAAVPDMTKQTKFVTYPWSHSILPISLENNTFVVCFLFSCFVKEYDVSYLTREGQWNSETNRIWLVYCSVVWYWLYQGDGSFTGSLGEIHLVTTCWTVAKASVVS